jgi:hypothetical protein
MGRSTRPESPRRCRGSHGSAVGFGVCKHPSSIRLQKNRFDQDILMHMRILAQLFHLGIVAGLIR